jgi:ABC-2 type transport system ATP-binding protein
MSSMSVLTFDRVHRSFAGRAALAGVSLEVGRGEVVGLVGRNGAGKSTLLRVALGLLHADRGSVRVLGRDPWRDAVEVKRRVGYVPDEEKSMGSTTARQLLDVHAALYPNWDEPLAQRLLGPLARQTETRLDSLSLGQRRRVFLACAIAHHPELLLLDEPAGGLDLSARREFLELAIELLNDDGASIVFSSHHMSDVERIAGRVVLIDRGIKLLDQELDVLKQEHCLALLPALSDGQLAALEQVPGFVRRRARGSGWHAVCAREPAGAEAELRQRLGVADVRCVHVNLEDLFVNLVGGEP